MMQPQHAKEEGNGGKVLGEPLVPTPVNQLIAPRRDNENGCCSWCCCLVTPRSNLSYEPDKNGKFEYKVRPSRCDTFLMLPPCMFLGCCMSRSANVSFNDNTQSVFISNWTGYICCPPFYSSITLTYSQIGNIGILDTGIREGEAPHQTPLYDVALVAKDSSKWMVGSRGYYNPVMEDARKLHHFVFGRNNPNYRWHPVVIPDDSSCCCY